ncbi:MAG: DUF1963 domain-containing protein [Neisseriaceae bacterium]|nr:DUF1963 domain-containing protein [Neisseriaceae bacterium]
MNTQHDFELSTQEIDELKKFLARPDVTIGNANKKPDFSQMTTQTEVKKYLAQIKKIYIYGYGVGVSKLTSTIQYLTQLEELYINGWRMLSMLPESIGQLKKLRILIVVDCGIKKLPESIVELTELTELGVGCCSNLAELPENIGKLNQLKKLDIGGYRGTTTLNHLPESIGQLTKLKKLHISRLPELITLPDSMGQLSELKDLEIQQCKKLSSLPASIAQLPKLRKFEIIECNNLNDIPENIQQLTCFARYTNALEQYEQSKNKKRPLTDEEKQAKKVLSQIKKDTATPIIKIKPKKAKKLPLTANKFGGVPYWDLQKPYPVDNQGNKLILLAQIDLAELPPLPDFPEKGLLQFFLSPDEKYLYGLDLDKPLQQDGWRVVYHENIDKNISEEMVLALDIPTAEMSDNLPLSVQYQLSFELKQTSISPCDYRFEKLFKITAEKLKIKFDEDDELLDLIEEETYDKLHNSTAGHRIGGYAFFTQSDPRYYNEELAEHKILLLQIDTEGDIMWGDAGVGNFFITADDLKKRNFSRVLYNWDCA